MFQMIVMNNEPKQVIVRLHCGNTVEVKIAGDVEAMITDVMKRKDEGFVFKLSGGKKTCFINSLDICDISIVNL